MAGARAIVWGGLAAGVLDTLLAMGLYRISATVVYQSVASGLLGRAAFQGGLRTAALGLVLHFFIATTAAAVYWGASRRLEVLVRRPAPCGLAFGLAVYFFMHGVVLPLSAARNIFSWPELIGHALLVGLPIALVVARSGRGRVLRPEVASSP
jgi:hypothetical protein